MSTTGAKGPWRPLEELCSSSKGDDESRATNEYRFFKRQLDLIGKLCLGRNAYCIEVITHKLGILTWEECFFCMRHSALPPSLRAKYVALCVNLFIDVENNQNVLYQPKLNFAWNELSESAIPAAATEPSKSITGASLPFFEPLHDWLFKYLASQEAVYHTEVAENKFLASVLDLLQYLVAFGYYVHPKNIIELLGPLKSVVDGRDDMQFKDVTSKVAFEEQDEKARKKREEQESAQRQWQRSGRYANNGVGDVVARVKSKSLQVINTIMNLATSFQLGSLLYDFKQISSTPTPGGRLRASRRGRLVPTFYDSMFAHIMNAKDGEEDSLLRYTPEVRSYVQELFDKSNWVTPDWHPSQPGEPHDLVLALEDLTHYDYNSLLSASQSLLMRIYGSREDLFRLAGQSQLLVTANSAATANHLSTIVPALARLASGYVEPGEVE